MAYKDVTPPAGGKITTQNGRLTVPDNPVLPFIRGDGTGPDIWAASQRVFDAAVQKAYGGKRKVSWFEVFAGETAFKKFNNWLPDDTVDAFKDAMLELRGTPGSRASCGELGEFPVPSRQTFGMTTAARRAGCTLIPPPGSGLPVKTFDVTLSPGRVSSVPPGP